MRTFKHVPEPILWTIVTLVLFSVPIYFAYKMDIRNNRHAPMEKITLLDSQGRTIFDITGRFIATRVEGQALFFEDTETGKKYAISGNYFVVPVYQ